LLPDAVLAPAPAARRPTDEAGIVDAIRDAIARQEPLAIEGRGTKRGMLRPVQSAATLSTAGLTGITLHSPSELIVSARAGTPIPDLEATLAQSGQGLVSEPPDLSTLLGEAGPASIGGIVATNLSGPRRVAWGATRDHVMGIRAVNGRADLIRSGGRVLKNVTGLDLCKLVAGSHGTLAVLTEVTLKVLPLAERTGSLVIAGLRPAEAVDALSRALGSPFGVSGAAYLPETAARRVPALAGQGRGPLAIIRIEDFAHSVEYRLGKLADMLARDAAATRLDHVDSLSTWRAIRDARPLETCPGDAVWRVSVRPSAGPGVLKAVEEAGARAFLDWGGGLVWVAGPPALHDRVVAAACLAAGTWTLLHGPDTMRAAVQVIPPEPEALACITRRVKAAMDPHGILNPGRMTAGL
jgi:glycolate oxidase FAD binding subunit